MQALNHKKWFFKQSKKTGIRAHPSGYTATIGYKILHFHGKSPHFPPAIGKLLQKSMEPGA